MNVFAVLLLSLFSIGQSVGLFQEVKGSMNSKSFRQVNCGLSENSQKRYSIATCPYWPNANVLMSLTDATYYGQVNFLIVMANLGKVNSSMIAPLSAQFNLVGLYVAKCSIYDISPDAFSTLTRVREISLSGNSLKNIPLGLFAKTKMINMIDLSNNNLQSLDTRMFQGLENLNVLDLSGNSLSNIPENLPRTLTNLNLQNNLINQIQSAKLPNLEYLNICQNNVTSGLNFITMIGCFKLHVLCFDDEMVRRSHTELHQLTKLQEFTINGRRSKNSKITSGEMASIGACTKLRKFKIERCDLDSLNVLTHLSELITLELKEVYISNKLSASDFNGVAAHLKTLDLTGSSRLAQTILGNPDIKFQKLEAITLKDCELKDLSWIPQKEDHSSGSLGSPSFPSLSTVDISGNNNFDCQDQRVKQALCRFDNLKPLITPSPKIVNKPHLRLENSNMTNCREQTMSFVSILRLNFSDCQETGQVNGVFKFSGGTLITSTEIPNITNSINKPNVQARDDVPSSRSRSVYVVLGVILVILFLVAVVLAVLYYRRRRCQQVEVSPDNSTKQGIINPQQVQSEV